MYVYIIQNNVKYKNISSYNKIILVINVAYNQHHLSLISQLSNNIKIFKSIISYLILQINWKV